MLHKLIKSGFGGIASQVITFTTLPLIARLYDPTSINTWILAITTIVLVGSLSCLRYELAIVVEEKLNQAVHLMFACFLIATILSSLSVLY